MFNYLNDISIKKYAKISSIPLKKAMLEINKAGILCTEDDLVTKDIRRILTKLNKKLVADKELKTNQRIEQKLKIIAKAKARLELDFPNMKLSRLDLYTMPSLTKLSFNELASIKLNKEHINKIKSYERLIEIRCAVEQELDRLKDDRNLPGYFIFGALLVEESAFNLTAYYEYYPERVILDIKQSNDYDYYETKQLFKIGGFFLSGDMSRTSKGLKVSIPISNLLALGAEINSIKSMMHFGLYYILNSRGFCKNIVNFLEKSENKNSLMLKAFEPESSPINIKINTDCINNYGLNISQVAAIRKAIHQDITFIWGPPGTGKTKTIGALASLLVTQGYRVLITAPTNTALDTLLLSSYNHLSYEGKKYYIGRLGKTSDINCFYFTKESFKTNGFLGKIDTNKTNWFDYIVNCSLVAANFAQLAFPFYEFIGKFDFVLADEVSMSAASNLMIPSYFAKKSVVFGGDPRQLPPPFPDDSEQPNDWVSKNIFEKALVNNILDDKVAFLDTQYRMKSKIGEFISLAFYDGFLKSGLKNEIDNEVKIPRILFVNSQGMAEQKCIDYLGVDAQMRFNNFNASLCIKAIKIGLKNGFSCKDIGVISPYNAQVATIKVAIKSEMQDFIESPDEIKVSTIHSFQGQECKMIIFDFTDNNVEPSPLMIKESLINVALSRAIDLLFIIGNKDYLTNTNFFPENMVEIFKKMLSYSHIIDDYDLDSIQDLK